MAETSHSPGGSADPARERLPAAVRQSRILAIFQTSDFVSMSEMAQMFGVSGMTIRRDFDELDRRGLLTRTHGGAVPTHTATASRSAHDKIEPSFEQRRQTHPGPKQQIAAAAAAMIGTGETVALDVGTSLLALAERLTERRDLRVLTNSLRVATMLSGAGLTVYTAGGQVRSPELSVIGPQAIEALSAHFPDTVFLGVSGCDANGFYDYSPEDTEVKRAYIASAGRVIVLCDASKFNRRALTRIAPLGAVQILITDAPPPAPLAAELAAQGVEVILAP